MEKQYKQSTLAFLGNVVEDPNLVVKKNINSSNFQLTYISILVSPGMPLILGAAKSRRLSRLEGNLLASTHMAAD